MRLADPAFAQSSENEVGHFLVRPYAQQFILEMSEFYELVVFTAAVQEYADWILDLIDPQKCIAHRLYRQHCLQKNNVSIKVINPHALPPLAAASDKTNCILVAI